MTLVPVIEKVYILSLSEDEAKAVRYVGAHVGGNPKGLRGKFAAVVVALKGELRGGPLTGVIRFTDDNPLQPQAASVNLVSSGSYVSQEVRHLARVRSRSYYPSNRDGVVIIGEAQEKYLQGYPSLRGKYTVINATGYGATYATPDELLQEWEVIA